MRRAGVQRGVASIALAAMLTAGCGGDPQEQGGSSEQSSAAVGRQPQDQWVLAMDHDDTRVYILLDPETGRTTQVDLPEGSDTDTDARDILQVSADHGLAIGASTLPEEQVESATLPLYPLQTGAPSESLDLRTATGDPLVQPISAAFDPSDPDLLRVVDEKGTVWEVNLQSKAASKSSQSLDLEDGGQPQFNPSNGQPHLDGEEPYKGWPQPDGQILEDEESYPELPDGDGVVFQEDSGELWSFRVEGDVFRMYRADSASAAWEVVDLDPQPPIHAGEGVSVEWVRPPAG